MSNHRNATQPRANRTRITGWGIVVSLLTVLFIVIAPRIPANADDETSRWGVTPATADGPDGRVSIMHELDSGNELTDYVAIRNLGTTSQTFQLRAGDGFFTENGRFDMLPSTQESTDSGMWITIAPTVTVPAGQTVTVPFELKVPANAEPGDHAAGITASIVQPDARESQVGVESRVGVRVTTRVTGDLSPQLDVTVTAHYEHNWNPFAPGTLTIATTTTNSGNVRLFVAGQASTSGLVDSAALALTPDPNKPQELLPGDNQTLTVVDSAAWPLFVTSGSVTLAPQMLTSSGDLTALDGQTIKFTATAIPWPQLVLLGVLVGCLAVVVALRKRATQRTARLLEQAHERGRSEGLRASGLLADPTTGDGGAHA